MELSDVVNALLVLLVTWLLSLARDRATPRHGAPTKGILPLGFGLMILSWLIAIICTTSVMNIYADIRDNINWFYIPTLNGVATLIREIQLDINDIASTLPIQCSGIYLQVVVPAAPTNDSVVFLENTLNDSKGFINQLFAFWLGLLVSLGVSLFLGLTLSSFGVSLLGDLSILVLSGLLFVVAAYGFGECTPIEDSCGTLGPLPPLPMLPCNNTGVYEFTVAYETATATYGRLVNATSCSQTKPLIDQLYQDTCRATYITSILYGFGVAGIWIYLFVVYLQKPKPAPDNRVVRWTGSSSV
jgi:hypothetical protein